MTYVLLSGAEAKLEMSEKCCDHGKHTFISINTIQLTNHICKNGQGRSNPNTRYILLSSPLSIQEMNPFFLPDDILL